MFTDERHNECLIQQDFPVRDSSQRTHMLGLVQGFFPRTSSKIYVEYFLSNLKVLWIRARVQVHIVDTEKTTTVYVLP